jgi:predicted kinase
VELVIFVGLQGAGKSSFYRERFYHTHMRINLDMLKTRHRENLFVQACVESLMRFVVDNTNPSRAERAVYIRAAKPKKYRIVGYYFDVPIDECKRRNDERSGKQLIPHCGIDACAARLELPTLDEGFDELFRVRLNDAGEFVVEPWTEDTT